MVKIKENEQMANLMRDSHGDIIITDKTSLASVLMFFDEIERERSRKTELIEEYDSFSNESFFYDTSGVVDEAIQDLIELQFKEEQIIEALSQTHNKDFQTIAITYTAHGPRSMKFKEICDHFKEILKSTS